MLETLFQTTVNLMPVKRSIHLLNQRQIEGLIYFPSTGRKKKSFRTNTIMRRNLMLKTIQMNRQIKFLKELKIQIRRKATMRVAKAQKVEHRELVPQLVITNYLN